MSRSDFLRIIENVLTNYSQAVADRVLPVAREIETFPIGTWVNRHRGCGCIAGEYLVASEAVSRKRLVRCNVEDELIKLEGRDLGMELIRFGLRIDDNLCDFIKERTEWMRFSPRAILIED